VNDFSYSTEETKYIDSPSCGIRLAPYFNGFDNLEWFAEGGYIYYKK
jgi:hypothetical protein